MQFIRTLKVKKEKMQQEQEYLVAEKKERERLTERYIDDNYQWKGGFD